MISVFYNLTNYFKIFFSFFFFLTIFNFDFVNSAFGPMGKGAL